MGGTALKTLFCDDPNRKMPLPEWRTLTAQLFLGIEYIHSRDVVHCDVKPANVVVSTSTDKGHTRLQLIDFGCSFVDQSGVRTLHTRGEIAQSGLEYGTLYYRSPEVLHGDPKLGNPLDVWAAGCTVTEFFPGPPAVLCEQQELDGELPISGFGCTAQGCARSLEGVTAR